MQDFFRPLNKEPSLEKALKYTWYIQIAALSIMLLAICYSSLMPALLFKVVLLGSIATLWIAGLLRPGIKKQIAKQKINAWLLHFEELEPGISLRFQDLDYSAIADFENALKTHHEHCYELEHKSDRLIIVTKVDPYDKTSL